jgi:hypothetical protein
MPGRKVTEVERDLLGLGEEVRRRAVEGELADGLHRRELLGNELRRVEQVDPLEGLLRRVRDHLYAQLPHGEGAGLDGVVEVTTMEVRVDAGQHLRLLPRERVDT